MCGRLTVKATCAELVSRNWADDGGAARRPRYNECPTDPVDVVTAEKCKCELVPRWALSRGARLSCGTGALNSQATRTA